MTRVFAVFLSRVLIGALLLVGLLAPVPAAWAGSTQEAVLSGGCFWCLEHDLETLPGVISAESGYSGGHVNNPTYQQVSGETTGHQETVRVRFDPGQITYAMLLRQYWRNIDPLDGEGQFCDRGDSYRPVIFTAGPAQEEEAKVSALAAAKELGVSIEKVKVQIRPAVRFWSAEPYHQNYADRNPIQYNYYRWACGRDRRLDAVWNDNARQGSPWR
ncbi:peptide-methionine (S)-S-oxide reductase MsrA [Synechococcus sp. MIT S9451]|uniref:peptide-methionine (S)-S-oxide reductase MsrA n=1 Tax=Synechococcus sp. MIT S9451 TaxID=3082543 RepID=UPI0039B648E3